jgi:hypothetical protein
MSGIARDVTVATAPGGTSGTGPGQREVLGYPHVPRPEGGDLIRGNPVFRLHLIFSIIKEAGPARHPA